MSKALSQWTLRKLKEPVTTDLGGDIAWVCNSLGFAAKRDQDKTAIKIMNALIHEAKRGKGLTSEQLAAVVKPTIGSVIYHLNKLAKAGLVTKERSVYQLRMNSLLTTIQEIEKDMLGTLDTLKHIATDVDKAAGLTHRKVLVQTMH